MQVIPIGLESSITSKGQITLPILLRQKYGLKKGGKVVFGVSSNFIKVMPSLDLSSVFGSVTPLKKKVSLKEMKKIALEDKFNAIH